jgi:predicted MFS family arabinose efflux permease
VRAGWLVRGTGCLLWFGFTLGLSLMGAQRGRPGVYLATARTAYGLGALLGTTLAMPLLRRLPVLPTISGAWTLTAMTWAVIGLVPDAAVIAVAAALAGVTVIIGNAGVTAQITRGSAGPDRCTLLAGQSVVVNASGSAGLLAGGPVLSLSAPSTP